MLECEKFVVAQSVKAAFNTIVEIDTYTFFLSNILTAAGDEYR